MFADITNGGGQRLTVAQQFRTGHDGRGDELFRRFHKPKNLRLGRAEGAIGVPGALCVAAVRGPRSVVGDGRKGDQYDDERASNQVAALAGCQSCLPRARGRVALRQGNQQGNGVNDGRAASRKLRPAAHEQE